jgi:hypothetical protein
LPRTSLVGGDHRLAEFTFPLGNRGHRREIAAGHNKDLDRRPVDPGEGVARVLRAELADRIGIGGAEALEGDRL